MHQHAVSWHPQQEILSDEKDFHRRESCQLENMYVSHFVLPLDLHD